MIVSTQGTPLSPFLIYDLVLNNAASPKEKHPRCLGRSCTDGNMEQCHPVQDTGPIPDNLKILQDNMPPLVQHTVSYTFQEEDEAGRTSWTNTVGTYDNEIPHCIYDHLKRHTPTSGNSSGQHVTN